MCGVVVCRAGMLLGCDNVAASFRGAPVPDAVASETGAPWYATGSLHFSVLEC